MINGKPRLSQTQGSVERCNRDVENMLWTWIAKNPKPNPYQCPDCEKNYKTKQELQAHITSEHDKGDKQTLRCFTCEKSFKTTKLFESHMTALHEENNPCNKCKNDQEPKAKPWWSKALRLVQYAKNARYGNMGCQVSKERYKIRRF